MQLSTFAARLAFRSRLIPLSKAKNISRAVTNTAVGTRSGTVFQSTVNRQRINLLSSRAQQCHCAKRDSTMLGRLFGAQRKQSR